MPAGAAGIVVSGRGGVIVLAAGCAVNAGTEASGLAVAPPGGTGMLHAATPGTAAGALAGNGVTPRGIGAATGAAAAGTGSVLPFAPTRKGWLQLRQVKVTPPAISFSVLE